MPLAKTHKRSCRSQGKGECPSSANGFRMVMLAAASDQNWKSSEFGIIPADWSVHQISDFKPFITSGSRGWAKYYAEAGAPFIRITNLSHDDIYPDLRDLRFVQVAQADPEAKRTQLEAGDILISI